MLAVLSFVLLGFWVTARLWLHPDAGLRDNATDQAQFEWMLAHGARVVTEFRYPFFSYQMNVPDGVNLMANTSTLGITIPMAPITLLLGPHAAFTVFLTGALILTPIAWYLLFRRWFTSHVAAWVGAVFCGFSPGMVSHANGHPNIVAQFLIPLIIWRVLRLADPGRWLRNGVLLALVIVFQAFINLEILLLTAVGLGLTLGILVLVRPALRQNWRPFLAGLAVAAVLALAFLAYPLYVQFFGPNTYQGLSRTIRGYRADLAAYVAFSRESIAGDVSSAKRLAQNASEENAFFGWPLVLLVAALVWWLRRRPVVIALAGTGLLFALVSLGRTVYFDGHDTGIPAPWGLLEKLPILHSVVPTRWALAITPVVGVLLAYACQHVADLARQYPAGAGQIRFAAVTAYAMALVPVAPTPLPVTGIAPTPAFVTSGQWRGYLAGGRSLVTLPLPYDRYADPLRWSAQTGLEMPIARGYFLAPDTRPDAPTPMVALFSAPPRPTSTFFQTIAKTGEIPVVTPASRQAAVADLRYWRAGAVVLAPQRHGEALRQGMIALTGLTPVRTGGVWLWDVRGLAG